MSNDNCPICASRAKPDARAHAELALDQAPKDYRVFLCPDCGLRWLSPLPAPEDFQDIYDAEYYRSTHANNFSFAEKKDSLAACYTEIARRFSAFGVRDRLLDVGCGRGEFLAVALQTGIGCEGIEPSDYAAGEAGKLGIPIWQGTLLDFPLPATRYAGAYCGHVLEHVADAHVFLEKLHAVLAPEAPLYIEVPIQFDGILDLLNRWLGKRATYSDYSIHHHYFFTPKAITRLFEQHGFEVLSLTTHMPCRRARRNPGLRTWALQTLLRVADRFFQRGDVISVWARRGA